MKLRSMNMLVPAVMVLLAALAATRSVHPRDAWSEEWERSLRSAAEADRKGDPERAESLFHHALELSLENGPGTLRHVRTLDDLAYFHLTAGRHEEAIRFYLEAIPIWERLLGPDQPRLAISLHNLGAAYIRLDRETEAEPLVTRAIRILEGALGTEHPDVANALQSYSVILRRTGRSDLAAEIEARITPKPEP